jgi:hypothetical protein
MFPRANFRKPLAEVLLGPEPGERGSQCLRLFQNVGEVSPFDDVIRSAAHSNPLTRFETMIPDLRRADQANVMAKRRNRYCAFLQWDEPAVLLQLPVNFGQE